ncbi:MAG: hypothetical protein JRI91_15285 [Deltaproteobacteria bacterium]|nr:hypothetical protein [Deltaproteobacteria bacterium]
MNFSAKGCGSRNLSGILYGLEIMAFSILGLLFVFASVSDGSPDLEHITGNVTVFQKELFGKLKKKKDMSGVLVYITGFKSEAPGEIPDIVQKNKIFYPEILPIVAGQKVRFPNHDDIYHNVFSISHVNCFDLGQYKGTEAPKTVLFEKPGLVTVFCNIHPQMITYVAVLENKAYAVTDKDGTFQIRDVPLGAYKINAWLPNAARTTKEVVIKSGQRNVINLEISETIKVKPHKRKDGSEYPAAGCKTDG